MSELYSVYVMDISYFSGKFEAYLRYKNIPYKRIEVGWRELAQNIYRNTGEMRVPVVRTPEGLWLQDSTPMIDWFEEQHPTPTILPADPFQAFFCRLLEDYADEWLWRPALHYRWSYPRDADLLARRIASEVMFDMPGPRRLFAERIKRRQRKQYVRGDGVTDKTRQQVEEVYLQTLRRLESVFQRQPFLLGGRPSLADFGFFASMFRHFSLDPTPSRIMRDRAPGVYEWVARLWNTSEKNADGSWFPAGSLPKEWDGILDDVGQQYLPYLRDNAIAWRNEEAKFDCQLSTCHYESLPVVQYRVWCRERLQQHFHSLNAQNQGRVQRKLEKHHCWSPLWDEGEIASNLHPYGDPPLCGPPARNRRLPLLRRLFGTSWNAKVK